jgi:D-amino-acid dehydrogenase
MTQGAEIAIIGGGIIGAACASELAESGADVIVIDQSQAGHGCSYGNAGWVTPCFALPLAMPGMLPKVARWLRDPESPLHIPPRASPSLAWWLARFAASMNERALERGVAALTELSKFSLAVYGELAAASRGMLRMERKGLLLVAASEGGLADARRERELVGRHGIEGCEVDGDALRRLEPSVTGNVAGGVYFPNEAHLEPLQAVRLLLGRARGLGTRLQQGAEVFEFRVQSGRVKAIRTTRGWVEADQFVLATGTWSRHLGRMLRVRIPVLGGKGYAAIVPPFHPKPRIPMMLVERKIAVTPRDRSVRLAGTLELVEADRGISPRRLDAILKGARSYLEVPEEPEVREVWRGLRPCTPDGVPIIGRPGRYENLIIATGHQMLGLQTAPATGRLVADLALNRSRTFDATPFDPDRF